MRDCIDAHVESAVRGDEAVKPGREPLRGKRRRRVDREHARSPGRADLLHCFREPLEAFVQFRLADSASIRQLEPACASPKKLHAEDVLETLDLMAYRSRRHVQFGGRAGKARQTGSRFERAQRIERRKAPAPSLSNSMSHANK